jgi:hypothetical protein
MLGLSLSLNISLAIAKICIANKEDRHQMLPSLYAKANKIGINLAELNSMSEGIIANWAEWGALLKIQTSEITTFAEII